MAGTEGATVFCFETGILTLLWRVVRWSIPAGIGEPTSTFNHGNVWLSSPKPSQNIYEVNILKSRQIGRLGTPPSPPSEAAPVYICARGLQRGGPAEVTARHGNPHPHPREVTAGLRQPKSHLSILSFSRRRNATSCFDLPVLHIDTNKVAVSFTTGMIRLWTK